jgi:hypothetical protein
MSDKKDEWIPDFTSRAKKVITSIEEKHAKYTAAEEDATQEEMDAIMLRALGVAEMTPQIRAAGECILATIALITYERLALATFPRIPQDLTRKLAEMVGPALAHGIMALVGGETKARAMFVAIDAWQASKHGK